MTTIRKAFTLVELLVVIATITTLIGLLMPAIQAVREASRRAWCQNNLRQTGLAILNFEQANRQLPIGSRSHTIPGFSGSSYGLSWWVDVLPYFECSSIHNRLDRRSVHHGLALLNSQNAQLADGLLFEPFFCPSSPLPQAEFVGNSHLGMPSYVGISGAVSSETFQESRTNACCSPKKNGQISAGGVLIPNTSVKIRAVTDGTTHTLIVGETSDYAHDADGNLFRIDGGYALGWFAGTKSRDTPPNYVEFTPAYNITTIGYQPNERRYELAGIYTDHGPNNPLTSAHTGGVNTLLLGGGVAYLTGEISISVLKQLATRDESGLESKAY